jgi:hypothetical protein
MATKEELLSAFSTIRDEADKGAKALNWAGNYARRGVHLLQTCPPEHDYIRTQILYLLSNISSWRSADAKRIRTLLKAHVGLK